MISKCITQLWRNGFTNEVSPGIFTLTGNPDMQTESAGQERHFRIPSGECCPSGHKESVPLSGSHWNPAGHSLQSTLSSELIRPGKQG